MKITRALRCIGGIFMALLPVDREYHEIRNKRVVIRIPSLKAQGTARNSRSIIHRLSADARWACLDPLFISNQTLAVKQPVACFLSLFQPHGCLFSPSKRNEHVHVQHSFETAYIFLFKS